MRVREYWTHGLSTIVDFARKPVSSDAVQAIREALEFAGIEFIDENGGAGVRLRKRQRPKKNR